MSSWTTPPVRTRGSEPLFLGIGENARFPYFSYFSGKAGKRAPGAVQTASQTPSQEVSGKVSGKQSPDCFPDWFPGTSLGSSLDCFPDWFLGTSLDTTPDLVLTQVWVASLQSDAGVGGSNPCWCHAVCDLVATKRSTLA